MHYLANPPRRWPHAHLCSSRLPCCSPPIKPETPRRRTPNRPRRDHRQRPCPASSTPPPRWSTATTICPGRFASRGCRRSRSSTSRSRSHSMHTDIPRLRAGGVKVQFWSVYVPAGTGHDGKALATTLEQIALVKAIWPNAIPSRSSWPLGRRHRASLPRGQDRLADRRGRRPLDRKLAGRAAAVLRAGRPLHDAHPLRHARLGRLGDRRGTQRRPHAVRRGGRPRDEPPGHAGRYLARLGADDEAGARASARRRSSSRTRRPARSPTIRATCPTTCCELTAENGGVVMVNFYPGFVVPSAAERSKRAIPCCAS